MARLPSGRRPAEPLLERRPAVNAGDLFKAAIL
jgi:hypothetical protein